SPPADRNTLAVRLAKNPGRGWGGRGSCRPGKGCIGLFVAPQPGHHGPAQPRGPAPDRVRVETDLVYRPAQAPDARAGAGGKPVVGLAGGAGSVRMNAASRPEGNCTLSPLMEDVCAPA